MYTCRRPLSSSIYPPPNSSSILVALGRYVCRKGSPFSCLVLKSKNCAELSTNQQFSDVSKWKKKKKKGTNQQSPSYGKSEKKIALLGNLCPLGRKSKWEYKWEGTKIPLNKAQNCVLVLCISFTPQGNSVLMFIYLITFAAPQGVWDLRSLTRDGTHAPYIGSVDS